MNNQWCKIRPEVVNINSDNPFFFTYSVEVNKFSGSFYNITKPYSKLCVPNAVKNINLKVFNLVSRTNETRRKEQHETCKFKCRIHASVCDDKKRWNEDKCRCECKELIDKGRFDEGFIWNPSNCKYGCGKPCGVAEYLNFGNCKCRKKLVDKIVKKCSENIDENEMIGVTLNNYGSVCNSYTMYIVLFVITFLIMIGITSVYFYWYLKQSNTNVININLALKQ